MCQQKLYLQDCGLTTDLLLRTNFQAKYVNLACNQICDNAAPIIARLFQSCTELDLSGNRLSDKLVQRCLVELDEGPCELVTLNLEFSGVGPRGLSLLCTALETHLVKLEEVVSEVVCEELVSLIY